MESVHIRIPDLVLARIDAWAETHAVDRSTAIRSLITDGLDRDGLIFTIERAIEKKDIGLTKTQVADLGTALTYALLLGIGKSPEEMSVLNDVRNALLKK